MGHNYMYWYQQDPGMELQLIYYSYAVKSVEKEEQSSEATASRTSQEQFSLTFNSTSPSQTSWYFCASSEYTALQGHLQPARKP